MNSHHGFSLTETLIVLSLISIITALAIPSQKYLFQKSSAQLAGAELFHAIEITRTEAILKNKTITLSKAGEWNHGYFIKMRNKILYHFSGSASEGTIYWRSFPAHRADIGFLPTGFSSVENGTFWFCYQTKNNPEWAIMLSQSGRTRMIHPRQDGKIYDDREEVIKC